MFLTAVSSGNMAFWQYGVLAIWRSGNIVFWQHGVLAIWRSGNMAFWQYGVLAIWRSGNKSFSQRRWLTVNSSTMLQFETQSCGRTSLGQMKGCKGCGWEVAVLIPQLYVVLHT